MTYITEESQPVTVGSAAKLIPHMTGTWCTAFRSVADPIKEMYYFTAILSQLSKHKRGQKWTQENSKQVTGKFGNLKTGSWECANNIYLHMWVVLQFTTSRRTRCGTLLKRWCVDLPIATLWMMKCTFYRCMSPRLWFQGYQWIRAGRFHDPFRRIEWGEKESKFA